MSNTLYEISNNIKQVIDMMEENPELDLKDTLDSLEDAFEKKAENIIKLTRSWEAEEKALQEEAKYLKAKSDKLKNDREKLMGYLEAHMTAVGKDETRAGLFTLKFQKNPASVNIVDENLLPEAYLKVKITKSPDKTAIKKILKDGQEVPGAVLITDKRTLKVK